MKHNPVIILRTTNKCNLNCTYCYDKKNDKLNTDEQFEEKIDEIIENIKKIYIYPEEKCKLILHGGEPLIIKPHVYDMFLGKLIKIYSNINFSVQTNGIGLNEEYIKVFKKYNVRIGISLDGYDEETNKCRIFDNGKNSFNTVLKKVKILQDNNINFGIIMTISKSHIGKEKQLYNFIAKNKLNCNIRAAFPVSKNDKFVLNQAQYAKFFINLFELWYNDEEESIEMKQILDMYEQFLMVINPEYQMKSCSSGLNCFGNFLSLDIWGNVYSCNRTYNNKGFYYGNLNEITINEIIYKAKEMEQKRSNNILMGKCSECPILKWCYGGCPANAYSIYKDYIMPEDYFCNGKIEVYNYVKNKLLKSGDIEVYNEYRERRK